MLVREVLPAPGAVVRIHVERAYDFDEKTGLWVYRQEDDDEEAHNLLTNAGRVQLHAQCYATSDLLTNGFNWIGLSNDAAMPAATDTALAFELVGNGLSRAQGAVVLPTGPSNQTMVVNTFIFAGTSQSVQKTALFTQAGPPVSGVMNHEVSFTPRSLFQNDILTLTFTISLG